MYLQVRLLEEEADALKRIAEKERRPARQQAAFLIREALERRGLLVETAVDTQQGVDHDGNQ